MTTLLSGSPKGLQQWERESRAVDEWSWKYGKTRAKRTFCHFFSASASFSLCSTHDTELFNSRLIMHNKGGRRESGGDCSSMMMKINSKFMHVSYVDSPSSTLHALPLCRLFWMGAILAEETKAMSGIKWYKRSSSVNCHTTDTASALLSLCFVTLKMNCRLLAGCSKESYDSVVGWDYRRLSREQI